MTTKTTQQSLTRQSIDKFVSEWYTALDEHRPFAELNGFLHSGSIRFVFPEVTVTDRAGLQEWYERVTRTFFDEEHTIRSVETDLGDEDALVRVSVQWKTRVWNPPQPASQILTYVADQTWKVVPGADGRPVIHTYIVDTFTPIGDTPALT